MIVCFQAGQTGTADATLGAGVLGVELDLVHLEVVLRRIFFLNTSSQCLQGKECSFSSLASRAIFSMELSDVILHGCQLPFSELAFCALVAVLLQDVCWMSSRH